MSDLSEQLLNKYAVSKQGPCTRHIAPRSFLSTDAFVWFVMVTTMLGAVGRPEVLGFRICGWAWLLALLAACLLIAVVPIRSPIFPIKLWLPFFVYVLLRSESLDRDELQRVAILAIPIVVAFAASLTPLKSLNTLRVSYYVLFVVTTVSYVALVVVTGSIDGQPIFIIAGAAMTWTITALFAAVEIQSKSRFAWVVLAGSYALCVITQGRMPMLVIPVLFLLGPTGMSYRKRILWGLLFAIVAPIVFYTPLIQSYVFRHGQTGTMRDAISIDPKLVSSAGRLTMWPKYIDDIQDIWLGHGSIASVEFGNFVTGGKWSHPHNDYIRILYDYGLIGIALLAIPTVWVLRECCKGLLSGDINVMYLYRVAFCGVLAMFLLAITGNTIMYSTWIGNSVFATLGVAFAEQRKGLHASGLNSHPWPFYKERLYTRKLFRQS